MQFYFKSYLAIGPNVVLLSKGFPIIYCSIFYINFSTNRSKTWWFIKNLFALIQTYPLFNNLDYTANLAARSKSASNVTIKGSEPPKNHFY